MKKLLAFMLITIFMISTLACGCTKKSPVTAENSTSPSTETDTTINNEVSGEISNDKTSEDCTEPLESDEDNTIENTTDSSSESTNDEVHETTKEEQKVTENTTDKTTGTSSDKVTEGTTNKTAENTTENKTTQATTTKQPEPTKGNTQPPTTKAPTAEPETTTKKETVTTKAPETVTTKAPETTTAEPETTTVEPTTPELSDKSPAGTINVYRLSWHNTKIITNEWEEIEPLMKKWEAMYPGEDVANDPAAWADSEFAKTWDYKYVYRLDDCVDLGLDGVLYGVYISVKERNEGYKILSWVEAAFIACMINAKYGTNYSTGNEHDTAGESYYGCWTGAEVKKYDPALGEDVEDDNKLYYFPAYWGANPIVIDGEEYYFITF